MTMQGQESSNTKEVTRKSVDQVAEEKLSKTINDAIRKIDLKVEIQVEVGDSKVFRLTFSTVVFWVARGKPSPCPNHRLLGEQRGEEIFRPLPEFETLVGIQDHPLNECLRLLTTRFPNGFDG